MSTKSTRQQYGEELVLRFISYRNAPYTVGEDVHEYLDQSAILLAEGARIKRWSRRNEEKVFKTSFEIIHRALGKHAFRRWDGSGFRGRFLISVFDVIAYGVPINLASYASLSEAKQKSTLERKARDLWGKQEFIDHSGAGVPGRVRLRHLLPFAAKYMKP